MLIPKYWAKASQVVDFPQNKQAQVRIWRWSETSESDAQARAVEALKNLATKLRDGQRPKKDYEVQAVREEVLKEFQDRDGKLNAAVTRSHLGFSVLNTEDLAFVDMDYDLEPEIWFLKFFKKKQNPAELRSQWEIAGINRVHQVFLDHSLGGRLYRTHNGLRAMVTSRKLDATKDEAEDLLFECGSDKLYRKLCEKQQSYRARLSPKPKRLQMKAPLVRFPFENESEKSQYQSWLKDYEAKSRDYGACEYLQKIGIDHAVPVELRAIVEFHDEATKALEKRPLK